jgi:hypothetical protein
MNLFSESVLEVELGAISRGSRISIFEFQVFGRNGSGQLWRL